MIAVDRFAQDQQALLRAVLGGQQDDSIWEIAESSTAGAAGKSLTRRGLLAYQSHGLALAERALGASYPVIAQLMGDENFAALARHFWRAHPPTCGDMGQWGDRLASFLAAAPQLAAEPFLADVAHTEWALHRASFAADSIADLASFGLLSAEPPAAPSLKLSPGAWLLQSAFPVVSLMDAHFSPVEEKKSALAHAATALSCGIAETALVWRDGFKPRLRRVGAAEHALLSALKAGHSLELALTQAGHAEAPTSEPAFDFTTWLSHSVQCGLVTGARLITDITYNNKEVSP